MWIPRKPMKNRQIEEKYIEQNTPLFFILVDITKTFDIVNREVVQIIQRKLE